MALSDFFSGRRKERPDGAAGVVYPTKVLGCFLTALARRSDPMLLDLGPVVGTNVTFFGEALGCKVLVEDLLTDVERHASEGTLDALPALFDVRIPHPSDSIDGILCWDVFDYLDRPASERLVRQLTRVLRPGGVVLAIFSTAAPRHDRPSYTRHVVIDRTHLEYRAYAGTRARQPPLVNRDVQRLFEPLRITENFLFTTNVREVMFRKPDGGPAAGAVETPGS